MVTGVLTACHDCAKIGEICYDKPNDCYHYNYHDDGYDGKSPAVASWWLSNNPDTSTFMNAKPTASRFRFISRELLK
jgi:hypothetical protein